MSARAKRLPWPVLLALVALADCASGPPITGTWVGERPISVAPGADPDLVRAARRVELQVEPSGRAVFISGGMVSEGRVTGTADRARYEAITLAGIAIERQAPDVRANASFDLRRDGSAWIIPGGIALRPVRSSPADLETTSPGSFPQNGK